MRGSGARPGTRRQALAIAALFAAIVGLRLLAVFPPAPRLDATHVALQACRILEGERPLFWSGQAWMGALPTYGLAGWFALFGANTLVLALYAWFCAAAWVGVSLTLAWRFFGPRAALVAAVFWLVPSDLMLYWSSQARGDYHALFIATPAVLLLAQDLVRRHWAGRESRWRTAFFGFFCGVAFWQNMAIGPCLLVALVVLLAHLGRRFWSRFLGWYAPAWLLGFAPVLLYNARNDFPILGQGGGLNSPGAAAAAVSAFAGTALPAFWGLSLSGGAGSLRGALTLVFLCWVAALFALTLVRLLRGPETREELLALRLALGLVGLHLLVLFASGYGTRAESTYFMNLWAVVPALLAAALLRASPRLRWALASPLLILVVLNLRAPAEQAHRFAAAWSAGVKRSIQSFPEPRNRVVAGLQAAGLGNGYHYDPLGSLRLTLAGLGTVEAAHPFADRVVEYALRADAAQRFFWVKGGRIGAAAFEQLGAGFERLDRGTSEIYHGFRRPERAESLIEKYDLQVSHAGADVGLLLDRRIGTAWALPDPVPEAWLRFDFRRPEPVSSIVLLPRDAGTVPPHLIVQRSADGVTWQTAAEWRSVRPIFWSVRHPFLKLIKPRCELVLPQPQPARFLRLLVPGQAGRLEIREIFLAREDPPARTPLALDEELAAIDRELAPLRSTHRIAGDHWFMSSLALRGFDVEFLPNRSVDNAGRRNPFLSADVPLDFSRPLCLIVPSAHAPGVAHELEGARVPHRRSAHQRYELFVTQPARVAVARYWSGLGLLETTAVAR